MTTPEECQKMATVLLEWVEDAYDPDYPLDRLLDSIAHIRPGFTRYLLTSKGYRGVVEGIGGMTSRAVWKQVACYLTLTRAGTGVP